LKTGLQVESALADREGSQSSARILYLLQNNSWQRDKFKDARLENVDVVVSSDFEYAQVRPQGWQHGECQQGYLLLRVRTNQVDHLQNFTFQPYVLHRTINALITAVITTCYLRDLYKEIAEVGKLTFPHNDASYEMLLNRWQTSLTFPNKSSCGTYERILVSISSGKLSITE
jgi:hypothetical protein